MGCGLLQIVGIDFPNRSAARFVRWDALYGRRIRKGLQLGTPRGVLGTGQAQHPENRGYDIQVACTIDPFFFARPRGLQETEPAGSVPAGQGRRLPNPGSGARASCVEPRHRTNQDTAASGPARSRSRLTIPSKN